MTYSIHWNTVTSIVIKYKSLLLRPKKNHSSVEEKYADYPTDLYEVKDNQFIIAHLGTMNVFHPKLNVEGEMKGQTR